LIASTTPANKTAGNQARNERRVMDMGRTAEVPPELKYYSNDA
jgi:hypothetical protein